MDPIANPGTYSFGFSAPFYFPREHGKSVYSIAVSSAASKYILAGYTIMTIFAFSASWALITAIVMRLGTRKNAEKPPLLLVGFLNAHEPLTASVFLAKYIWNGREKKRWALALFTLSVTMYAGGMVAGVVVPKWIFVGNGAPANSGAVYFQKLPLTATDAEKSLSQSIRAPAMMRAFGSVQAAATNDPLRKRVSCEEHTYPSDTSDPIASIEYNYNLSAWDFGMQRYESLSQTVRGKCTTDYTWLANSTEDTDRYRLWDQDIYIKVLKSTETTSAPYAFITSHPDASNMMRDGNVSFAIIPHTAGHRSFTPSSDVWYTTTLPQNTSDVDDATYIVKNKIPVLSCWQTSRWVFQNEAVNSIYNENLTRHFSAEWKRYLQTQLALPRIISLGTALGHSILQSSTTALRDVFDASSSSMKKDICSLISASFVSSRNIFRDSTIVAHTDTKDTYRNDARDDQGQPAHRIADFVLSTSDVSTASVATLITIPAVLVAMYIGQLGLWVFVYQFRRTTLAWTTALEATQLWQKLKPELEKGVTQ